jgi:ATP-dependent DNA helicase RecG
MLSKQEIQALIADMESDHVERTVSTNNMDKFGEAVCAFSNDISDRKKPGYLLIGVDDKTGELSGLKATDEMLRNISSIRSEGNVLPQPALTVHKYTFDRGDVIVVEVKPANFPPVRSKGTIWLRIGPRRAVANEMEERMLIEKRTANITTFDEFPMAQTTIDDLNIVRFKLDYLPKAVDQNTIQNDDRDVKLQLASLRFYDMRSDCPTVAGILTFGKNVRFYFPMAYIQYVKYEGTKVSSRILAENQFLGDLISVVDDLDRFVRNNIVEKRPVPVSALREKLIYNYPQWALREFLMNALMHRSYEITAPIKFYQFADRIEIINPGGLYGNARPENFPNVSDYRNLILSEAMRVMGFVNRFNRGIATAQLELTENGNNQAEFNINTLGVFGVTIWENKEVVSGGVNGANNTNTSCKTNDYEEKSGGINGADDGDTGDISGADGAKNGGVNGANNTNTYCISNDYEVKSGGINGADGGGINFEKQVLQIIFDNKVIRVDEICRLTQKPTRTIQRHLNNLKNRRLIDYEGTLKTGGYRINIFGVLTLEKNKNGGINDSGGVNKKSRDENLEKQILQIIYDSEGIKIDEICRIIQRPKRTVERYLNYLKKRNLIEFTGTPKTGGYRINAVEVMALENIENKNDDTNNTNGTNFGTNGINSGTNGTNGTNSGTNGTNSGTNGTNSGTNGTKTGTNGTNIDELTETENKVLLIIKEKRGVKMIEMAELLNIPKRTIARSLASLKQRAYVEFVDGVRTSGYQVSENADGAKSGTNIGTNGANFDELTETEKKVLLIIKERTGLKITEIVEFLNIPKRTIARSLASLKQRACIEYVNGIRTGGYQVTENVTGTNGIAGKKRTVKYLNKKNK